MKKESVFGTLVESILKGPGQAVALEKRIERESLDITSVQKIIVQTGEADIDIRVHDEPRVNIVLESYEDGPELTIDYSNDVLNMIAKRNQDRKLFSFKIISTCRLQISVPQKVADSWFVQTGSGDVTAMGVTMHSIDGKSGSGDMNFTEMQVDQANLRTSSGDLTLHNCLVNGLQFETSSGDAKLASIQGDVVGGTSSGSIIMTNCQGETFNLKTSSGDISLKAINVKKLLTSCSSGEIYANQIHTEKVLATASSGDIKFTSFSGEMKAHTGSGDISLLSVIDGQLDLSTGSGDIMAVFGKTEINATVEVTTSSGDIISKLPMNIRKQATNKLEGILGDGDKPIRIKTGSGDVRLLGQN